MSDTFFNKPPENPDKDTVYTMGGLENLPADLGNFVGSAAQLAQLYPGSQNRPQYNPGLTDLRFTRSFQGASPGGSFYSPSGAGNAPGPDPNKIVYQQPFPEYGSGNLDAALMGGLLGMDWSGAYDDYLKKLEAQTQDVNISNVFTPTNTNTFTPTNTFNPTVDTDIDVSPTISNVNTNTVSPNINVSQTQTQGQTQQQQQQQSQGGSDLDEFQDQDQSDSQDSFDMNDLLSGSGLAALLAALAAAGYNIGSGTGAGGANTGGTGTGSDTTITDDMVEGGLDTDFFNDTLTGGNTNDTLTGGSNNDFTDGGLLNDIIANDTLISGNNNDVIGEQTLIGSNNNDVIANDTLDSGLINDIIDTVDSGTKTDTTISSDVQDTVSGALNDIVDTTGGGTATDTVISGGGQDTTDGALQDIVEPTPAEQFVKSLYNDLLDRDPDASGLDFWKQRYESGASPEQIAREFISNTLGNDVNEISQAERDQYFPEIAQERERQAAEAAAQAEAAAEAERQRQAAEQAEAERLAAEAAAEANLSPSEKFVKNLYNDLLDRDPDPEGLAYWAQRYESGVSPDKLAQELINNTLGNDVNEISPEERDRYSDSTLYIKNLYNDILERDPDPEGLAYWKQQYEAGVSPEQIARNFIEGALGNDVSAISQEERDQYMAESPRERDIRLAAEAEEQRKADLQAETQAKVEPVVNEATTKFQSDIANAIKQRDEIKNKLDEAQREVYMHYASVSEGYTPGEPPFSQEVIDDLQASYTSLDNALKNYNVDEILKNPDYAREQAMQAGSDALQALTDPNNPPSPDAVNSILTKVVDSGLANVVAQNISEEGAKAILQAVGGDAAVEAFGSIAGDFAGPVGAALVSLAQGDSVGTAAAEAAKAYVVATLAAMPGVGQAIAAAIVLDSFLSDALGYESPINDAVAGAAKSVDKAISWTTDRAIGGDPLGAIGEGVEDFIGSIGNFFGGFGLAEGGLVDLPGDSMYNDNQQGVLADFEGYARGGIIPLPGGGKIAKGPGGGLDDLIPTSIDGKRAAALSDGEFVIPADVVSMMGDGSTNAGSKRLYDLVRQVRQHKTGTTRQAGPLQVGKILERTMK